MDFPEHLSRVKLLNARSRTRETTRLINRRPINRAKPERHPVAGEQREKFPNFVEDQLWREKREKVKKEKKNQVIGREDTARPASRRGTIRHNEVEATARVTVEESDFQDDRMPGRSCSTRRRSLVPPRHTAFAFTFSRGGDEQAPSSLLPVPPPLPRG